MAPWRPNGTSQNDPNSHIDYASRVNFSHCAVPLARRHLYQQRVHIGVCQCGSPARGMYIRVKPTVKNTVTSIALKSVDGAGG